LGKITDEGGWRKIAQLHSSDAVLDERSISLIKHQNPNLVEQEFTQLLRKFQDLIALDTVRNEYLLHSKLYTWIVNDPVRDDVEKTERAGLRETISDAEFRSVARALLSRCLHRAR
jgi:hypothetical protein